MRFNSGRNFALFLLRHNARPTMNFLRLHFLWSAGVTTVAGCKMAIAPRKFPASGFHQIDPSDKVEEEKLPTYDHDAYYPMRLGDVIKDRYQIVAKLGYGVTSTVWLCRDLAEKKRFWTLKVFTNKVKDCHELSIFKHLQALGPIMKLPGHKYVRRIEDSFTVDGPKGSHLIMVMTPLGMSLKSLRERQDYAEILSPTLAKLAILNVHFGVDFLHTAGLIHTDLHLDNLLVSLRDDAILESIEDDEIKTPSQRKVADDGTVIHTSMDFLDGFGPIIISDFGQARIGDMCTGIAMPTQYRAPEIILGMPWTPAVDNWSIGLIIWDLFESKPLFNVYDSESEELNNAHHLAAMHVILGCPPQEFLQRSEETKKYWDEKGNWIGPVPLPDTEPMPGHITHFEGIQEARFFDFAVGHLAWMPELRTTVQEAVFHPFLAEVSGMKRNG